VLPFDDIDAEHARLEGDGSLEYWRRAYRTYFEGECSEMGVAFKEQNVP
jgi:uncharacterized protein YhfF